MLRYVFIIFIAIHGLIHLPGFLKSFGFAQVEGLTQPISKSAGIFWLISFLLFLTAAILFLLNEQLWPFLALSGIVLSQVLIFNYWQDAKFGTLANLIILLVALPEAGNYFFNKKVDEEVAILVTETKKNKSSIIQDNDLAGMPPVVQNWLRNSGCIGKDKITSAILKQTGTMRIKPDGNWLSFTAEQRFNPLEPSFVWRTQVNLLPMIYLNGRDKFYNGEGEMLIRLLSLIDVVNEKNHEKINEGTAQRYLAEICWFPTAALSEYISWEEIDKNSAKATLKYKNLDVNGIFRFSDAGEITEFTTNRYYGNDANSQREQWQVNILTYKVFNGIKVPAKCSLTWKLKEGDFNWLNLEVTELEFNNHRDLIN